MANDYYYYRKRQGKTIKIYTKLWPKAYSDKRSSLFLVINPSEILDGNTGHLWEIVYSQGEGHLVEEPDLQRTLNLTRRSKKEVMLYDGGLTQALEELGFTVLPEHANDTDYVTFEDNVKKLKPKFIEIPKAKWKAKWVLPK